MIRCIVEYRSSTGREASVANVVLPTVPRIGEKVGLRPVAGQSPSVYFLDYVIDVRYYPAEVRVLTTDRP